MSGKPEVSEPPAGSDGPAPIEPMLAKAVDAIPATGDFLFEPKWDGFRAIVFSSSAGDVAIQAHDLGLRSYFPELHDAIAAALPPSCVLDGESVVAKDGLRLRRDAQRIQRRSRIARLARRTGSLCVTDVGRHRWSSRRSRRRAA